MLLEAVFEFSKSSKDFRGLIFLGELLQRGVGGTQKGVGGLFELDGCGGAWGAEGLKSFCDRLIVGFAVSGEAKVALGVLMPKPKSGFLRELGDAFKALVKFARLAFKGSSASASKEDIADKKIVVVLSEIDHVSLGVARGVPA